MFLYFRMFITMGVGLYTSRLVLATLGVEDYGIYGLVGGIVTMFAFMNSAMAAATQRYLSFDLGKNDLEKLKKTFNATLHIHILIAIIVVILAETLGLWFVNYKLNLPAERMVAANWVYQFSIFTFVLAIIQVPYNALLIAREHMKVYAYMSIIEIVLKLIIVFILVNLDFDKLILYAILTFCVTFLINILYKIYCKRNFRESEYVYYYDKGYYRELLSYSGWNLFGNIAAIARGQGSNILLNLFFGPIANAAYSLTVMVQGIIGNFISNFQTALNPQITKNYAKGDISQSLHLMFKSSKFSYFAMLILVVPILFNLDFLMHFWLGKVPPYTISFIRLALICSLVETISNPLMTIAQATGKIKWYQIVIGSLIFLTLPVTWLVFKLTDNPINFFWVLLGNSLVALVFRVLFLNRMLGKMIGQFVKEVLMPIILVSTIVIVLYFFANKFDKAFDLLELVMETAFVLIPLVGIIYSIGLDKKEKSFINNAIKKVLKLN